MNFKLKSFLFILILQSFIHADLATAQDRIFVSAGPYIYSVDTENCIADLKGKSLTFYDIAFTSDGRLWGIEPYGSIYQIDTTNADTTFIFDTGRYAVSLEGFGTNRLIMVSEKSLYEINLTTKSVTNLGYIDAIPSGDIAWYDDHLYLNSGAILRFDLDTLSKQIGDKTLISVGPSIGLTGYGLGVSMYSDSTIVMSVFDRYDVYSVCHIDGSTQLKCKDLIDQWMNGAAHIRYPTQMPQPEICYTMIPPTKTVQFFINHIDRRLTIHSSEAFENLTVTLFSMSGQVVKQFSGLNGTEFSFSAKELAKGIYIIGIGNANAMQSEKIMLR